MAMMKRLAAISWAWLLLAAWPAQGAVRAVPPIAAAVGAAPAASAAGLQPLMTSLQTRGDSEALALAERLYYTDPLTGLPNRAFLIEQGAEALRGVKDPAVSMLDMNNFGAVNVALADLHGASKGRARADAALAVAGATLKELAESAGVTVVRLGGEEFAALGSREKVLSFAATARRVLPAGRVLEAVGIEKDGAERRAIGDAMARLGRSGQSVGDFTYGVASLRGRSVPAALKAADAALNGGKDGGLRGTILVEGLDGGRWVWAPPTPGDAAAELAAPEPVDTVEAVARLEQRLTPQERALFHERAFRDPLTGARTYEYVPVQSAAWNAAYDGRQAEATLLSARNLKQINDVLGHDVGDRYLRRFGAVLRREILQARAAGLDVQEPVRVGSKEFLLVGADAEVVGLRVQRAVATKFGAGLMLTRAQIERLRRESVAKGLVPAGRAVLMGRLRVLSEPLENASGRADVEGALGRALERLELQKRVEELASR